MKLEQFCLIPARAGSKGIPNKNRVIVAGKPLIEWTMDTALECFPIDYIFVTTDDPQIVEISNRRGLQVIEREKHLADDNTPMLNVLRHALVRIRPSFPNVKATILLQPTSPLRISDDIKRAVEVYDNSKSSWLTSVTRVVDAHPSRMYRMSAAGRMGQKFWPEPIGNLRQNLDPLYLRNGAIYIFDNHNLECDSDILNSSPVLFEMPEERSINIDTPLDLRIIDFLLESRCNENRNS